MPSLDSEGSRPLQGVRPTTAAASACQPGTLRGGYGCKRPRRLVTLGPLSVMFTLFRSGQLWRPQGQGVQVVWACLHRGMASFRACSRSLFKWLSALCTWGIQNTSLFVHEWCKHVGPD